MFIYQATKGQSWPSSSSITTRDEIVVGITDGSDAVTLDKSLTDHGYMGLTQYAVRRAADGSLEQGPLRQVAILPHDTLRIEPYPTPLPVVG